MLGAADAGELFFVGVFMVSSLLNIAYLMPIVVRGFFFPPEDGKTGISEAPLMCVVPLCFTAVGSVALFFFADEIYRLLDGIVTHGG